VIGVPYDPGWLRHRVAFEAATETPDEAGGASLAWATIATLWAAIEPLSAREQAVADHRAGVVTHRIVIRWRTGIEGGMRAVYRGRYFRLLAIHDPDETRRYLVANATEEAP
jgi:SPP1 family predicted phage head-tail adaptor